MYFGLISFVPYFFGTFVVTSGSRRLFAIGRLVRVRRLIKRCAGLHPMPAVGVFRQSSRAIIASTPSLADYLMRFFAIFTPDSTLPFDLGRYRELVMCWKPHFFANFPNSSQWNCGPPSEYIYIGDPVSVEVLLYSLDDFDCYCAFKEVDFEEITEVVGDH